MQKLERAWRPVLLAIVALLAAPPVSEGQQSKAIPRLCFLTLEPGTLQTRSPRFDEFFQALRDLGYVDGQSITIDYLSADDHSERFPALADECLRRKADVIFATTTTAAQAAKKATSTVPIVVQTYDPVGTGLVNSLAQPGGNVTGTSGMFTELASKRLQLLKEAVPGISRVMVLTVDQITSLEVKAMTEAAPSLGVTLQVREIRNVNDISAAFDAAVSGGAEGLIVTGETIFATYRAHVSELAAQHRLPAMYPFLIQVGDGGLMGYVTLPSEMQRLSASYIDRILKGAKPSELPVQQPTKFHLVLNLKAADAFGFKFPPNFLALADQVIE
jgi:ABC-type uncharacterized transport system substrate-binding protein